MIATERFLRFTRRGAPQVGPVAQWSEPAAHNGLVAGSSPARPTRVPPGMRYGPKGVALISDFAELKSLIRRLADSRRRDAVDELAYFDLLDHENVMLRCSNICCTAQ